MMLTASEDPIAFIPSRTASLRNSQHPQARRRLTGLVLAALALLLAPAAAATAGEPPALVEALPFVPPNLQASGPLLQFVSRMARISPTFRAQCERIGRTTGLVVRMRYAGLRDDRPFNARTTVRRHEYGAVIAEVLLYVPLDPVEIVAHEFEHLVEQIQGTDLRGLSRVRGSGVVEVSRGEYETRRAIDAGRRVLAEYGDADRGAGTIGDETQP